MTTEELQEWFDSFGHNFQKQSTSALLMGTATHAAWEKTINSYLLGPTEDFNEQLLLLL